MEAFSLEAVLSLVDNNFTSGLNIASDLFGKFANMVTDFTSDVIETGLGFDRAMGAVEAVLGEQEGTVENMTTLREFALDQARESVFTAEQTADAYYYMGMAGWKSEQMMAGLPGIMALAAASGEDLGRVSDIVTDSITAFGLTADDVQGYVDILAQTVTNANTDVSALGEAFKYAAPIAGALGADVDDVAVSLGLMANAGIKGSMAGTSLRSIFTRLSTNAGETKNNIGALTVMQDKLGVAFWDSSGKMRDWSDIISDARVAWQGLDQETQIYYAKQIAGQRGMTAWLAIMNATETDVNKLSGAIGNASDAAQTMADVRLDNLPGSITKFQSAYDILKQTIFDDQKGPFKDVVDWATGALNDITDAIGENGIEGGIEMLATKIDDLGKKEEVQKLLKSLGSLIATLFDGVIDKLLPKLTEAAPKLLQALFSGFSSGTGTGSSILQTLTGPGSLINSVLGAFAEGSKDGPLGVLSSFFGVGKHTVGVQLDPKVSVNDIEKAITTALNEGSDTVEINGEKFTIAQAEAFRDQILYGVGDAPETIGSDINTAVSGGLTEGGNTGAESMDEAFKQFIDGAGEYLTSVIGSSGGAAGSQFGANFQSSLNAQTFSVDVNANVKGVPGGATIQHNARSMASGHIFRRPTIFGYADGKYQEAGDAGPEAVVGVSSLYRMINDAVDDAMPDAMNNPVELARRAVDEQLKQTTVEVIPEFDESTLQSQIDGHQASVEFIPEFRADMLDQQLSGIQTRFNAMPDMLAKNAEAMRDNTVSQSVAAMGNTVNTIYQLINDVIRAIMTTQDAMVRSYQTPRNMTIEMQLNGSNVGRVFYPYIEAERQRLGLNVTKGGAY